MAKKSDEQINKADAPVLQSQGDARPLAPNFAGSEISQVLDSTSELLERARAVQFSPPPQQPAVSLAIDFQSPAAFRTSDEYHVRELLSFHDRQFIECAYLAILKRAPAPSEIYRDVDEIRSGRISKIDFLNFLRGTDEGRAKGVLLHGLPSGAMKQFARLPFIGYVLRLLRGIWRLPVLMEDQRRFEAYVLGRQQQIADYVNQHADNSQLRAVVEDMTETTVLLAEELFKTSAQISATNVEVAKLFATLRQFDEQFGERFNQLSEEARALHIELLRRQEFLAQELHVLVETQRMAHYEMQDRFAEIRAAYARLVAMEQTIAGTFGSK